MGMDDNGRSGAQERGSITAGDDGTGHRAGAGGQGDFRIRIIRNPRSHRNAGTPRPDTPAGVEVIEPSRRGDTARALTHCKAAGTDCLVINGGDGTVRDVLTAGLGIFGDRWPVIGVLPRGKTNALAVDLGIPDNWRWSDIAERARDGRTVVRRPLVLSREGAAEPPVAGFLIGAGSFARGIEAAQDAHRIGMFGGMAVGMTLAWAVAQIIFGGPDNHWRRGQEMDIRLLPRGERLPHLGGGDAGRRSLAVATTLRHLPLGLKPFGPERDGLKLLVVDRARRRIYASTPFVLAGRDWRWLRDRGVHRRDAQGLLATFSERFILDGEFLSPGTWRIEQGPQLRFLVP